MPQTDGTRENREQTIIRTSVIGIAANVLLAGFKALVGLLSHSIAITLDAVNNLSDALSSIVTIIGAKLAGKPADKQHPMGHGRVEYLSAMIVAVLVLYAGITALVKSVEAIFHPETPDYAAASLIVVAVAVVVKIVLGRYVQRTGERVHSDSLIGSGKDALNDAIISLSTLAAAGVYLLWGVSLEAWLGLVISAVIIRSGVEMLRDTISQILGERVAGDISAQVKESACTVPGVYGAYDLVLHSYGPDRLMGSIHVEVDDTLTAGEIDRLERDVAHQVYLDTGVIMAGVSIYARNTADDQKLRLRREVSEIVMAHEFVLQMHGFFVDEERKIIRFDVVLDFAAPDREELWHSIQREVEAAYPGYTVVVTPDADISD